MKKSNTHRQQQPRAKGVVILYEDADLLVVDKSAGLLTMASDSEKIKTAYYILTDYVRKGQAKSRKRIFIVHRLDKETSGVMVFAKNYKTKVFLQGTWEKTEKNYLVIVSGKMKNKMGRITSYLAENKDHKMYSTSKVHDGKLSVTEYRVIRETSGYSLLEIKLLTGRKNQIRVHLAEQGHPVVGDKKYGLGSKGYKRLALHAQKITFIHPLTGKPLTFESRVPRYFTEIIEKVSSRV